jgi:hypothetical protein
MDSSASADQRMNESEPRLRVQDVVAYERIGGVEGGLLLQFGERSCLPCVGLVAEDRYSPRERAPPAASGKAKRGSTRAGACRELVQLVHVGRSGEPLGGDHVRARGGEVDYRPSPPSRPRRRRPRSRATVPRSRRIVASC